MLFNAFSFMSLFQSNKNLKFQRLRKHLEHYLEDLQYSKKGFGGEKFQTKF